MKRHFVWGKNSAKNLACGENIPNIRFESNQTECRSVNELLDASHPHHQLLLLQSKLVKRLN